MAKAKCPSLQNTATKVITSDSLNRCIIAFHSLPEDTVQVHDSKQSFTDLEHGSMVIRAGMDISRPDEIWGSGKCGQKARKPPFKQIQLCRQIAFHSLPEDTARVHDLERGWVNS